MKSPVQLSIPPVYPASHERTRLMFPECLNLAGFSVLERPMAQLYSPNALNGPAIDPGYHWTDVSAICDCFLLTRASALNNKRCAMVILKPFLT